MQETAPTEQPMPTKNSNSEYSVGMPVLEVPQTEFAAPESSTRAVVEAPTATPMLEAPEPTELLEAPEQPAGLIEAPEAVEMIPAVTSADTPNVVETESVIAHVDAVAETHDLADARADVGAATAPAVEVASPEVSAALTEPVETATPAPTAPAPAAKPSFFQRLFHRN